MKKAFPFFLFATLFSVGLRAQNPVNWTTDQLLTPAELVKTLTAKKEVPVIYSVGPGSNIPNSTAIGMVREEANLTNLKRQLSKLPKDTPVVIYCGCCPYEHCPNVRPAMALLKEMQFANYKLLDLPHNLKTDWIDKGYPTTKQ